MLIVFFKFDHLTIFPDANFRLFSAVNELAKTILLPINPISNILLAIRPNLCSIALTFIVKEFTFILDAIRLYELTVTRLHAVSPITLIKVINVVVEIFY